MARWTKKVSHLSAEMLAKLQPSDGWVERDCRFKSCPGLLLANNEASKSSRLQPERERLGGSKAKQLIHR